MTVRSFVKGGFWPALDEARCANWDRNTMQCIHVLSAVFVTAENVLRMFPKGSELKENTSH